MNPKDKDLIMQAVDEAMRSASAQDKAQLLLLTLIADCVLSLATQFDQVSASGNAIMTETAR